MGFGFWKVLAVNSLPQATHEGPVQVGKWGVHAYVLETEPPLRVIAKRSALTILSSHSASKLADSTGKLKSHPALQGHEFIRSGFDFANPVRFRKANGEVEEGFNAEDLVEFCRFLLKAREFGVLRQQSDLATAQAAEGLIVSIAKVGVTALIDEATGYQRDRDRHALRELLDRYLRKEQAAWAKRFPDEFYTQIFRLKHWEWRGMSINRPSIVGTYTRDIVYARLAPNIVQELERLNPKTERGGRKAKHHQWMTDDVGHPALNNHLQGVLAIMRASTTWRGFNQLLKRAYPRFGDQMELLDLEGSDLD
jgi:hypothetical protein